MLEYGPGEHTILVDDLKASYNDMCFELGLQRPRPWKSVAAAFAEMTRLPGRPLKTYRDWINHRGETRSRRVYILSLQWCPSVLQKSPIAAESR